MSIRAFLGIKILYQKSILLTNYIFMGVPPYLILEVKVLGVRGLLSYDQFGDEEKKGAERF